MKNPILSLLLLLSFWKISDAQWVTIPDPNFAALLDNDYPNCMDGNQMDTTCPEIMSDPWVVVVSANVSNLDGIQYFDSVTELDCNDNNLTSLPPLPHTLWVLDCHNNQLTSLPSSMPNLHELFCEHNLLTSLPTLPNTIWRFDCSFNQLTTINSLPSNLGLFGCINNYLSTLPTLPNNADLVVVCSSNQITSLPPLPSSMTVLYCDHNLLQSLPQLPDSMAYIDCSYNVLTSLPELPKKLQYLTCDSNQLTTLPALPDFMHWIYCRYNSSLTCFPQLTVVDTLLFDSTGIECIPNYGTVLYSQPLIDTIPLCSFYNPHQCPTDWNIAGRVYYDTNNNCSYDSSEGLEANVKLQLLDNANNLQQQVTTNPLGQYSFNTSSSGTYTVRIDTAGLPFDIHCPSTDIHTAVISSNDSLDYADFGIRCKSGFDIGAWSVISTHFVPGTETPVLIHAGDYASYFGAGCAGAVSGTIKVLMSGNEHYISPLPGALTPTLSSDTLIYAINDFSAINPELDFNIIAMTDTTAQGGDEACFLVIVNPLVGDNDPANNRFTHCFEILSSYDPNEKEVYPFGTLDTSAHWLTYTIHFQNTGTAPAQHIYLMDTLDANLDASTFQLVAYSHPNFTQVLEGEIVKFNFPNINLPDSSDNEPGSHGYVQYRIKLKDNLPIAAHISNAASIYFDFNPAVVTNTVVSTYGLADFLPSINHAESEVSVYPNPAEKFISIESSSAIHSVRVYDLIGREVLQMNDLQSKKMILPLNKMTRGIYVLKIETENGEAVKKVVVK